MTHSKIDLFAHLTDPIIRFLDKLAKAVPPPPFGPPLAVPERYFRP